MVYILAGWMRELSAGQIVVVVVCVMRMMMMMQSRAFRLILPLAFCVAVLLPAGYKVRPCISEPAETGVLRTFCTLLRPRLPVSPYGALIDICPLARDGFDDRREEEGERGRSACPLPLDSSQSRKTCDTSVQWIAPWPAIQLARRRHIDTWRGIGSEPCWSCHVVFLSGCPTLPASVTYDLTKCGVHASDQARRLPVQE